MKVLLIPNGNTVIPHLLPLIALASQLNVDRHESAFLAPVPLHRALGERGHNVLDIDYRGNMAFRHQMNAVGLFKPDVIVDDLASAALLTTKLSNKARVTIMRTGLFPGSIPRNINHRHSAQKFENLQALFKNCDALFGIPIPKNLGETCAAEMKVVPGIPEIEVLPEPCRRDSTFVFAGNLSVPDAAVPHGDATIADALQTFFQKNAGLTLVYVTLGSILKGNSSIQEMIRYMLDCGVGVISSVPFENVDVHHADRFFYASFLPMHVVCSNVRLMIHHCGSGTYQYAVSHRLPAICVGSQCYDRDDVAQRLDELGVTIYIPSADECPDFSARFRAAFDQCMGTDRGWYRSAQTKLDELRLAYDQAAAAFDFEAVLDRAVSLHRPLAKGARPVP